MRNHDVLLMYSKHPEQTFNVQYIPVSQGTMKRWKGKRQDSVFEGGKRYQVSTDKKCGDSMP